MPRSKQRSTACNQGPLLRQERDKMDIDKIVTDLLEKRLKDELVATVAEQFEGHGRDYLSSFVNETMRKLIIEMEDEIKNTLRTALEISFKDNIVIPEFSWNIKTNLPSYELRAELERREKKEQNGRS